MDFWSPVPIIHIYAVLSVIVSLVIFLLAGATNISRKNKKNILEPENMWSVEATSPVGI